MNNDIKFFYKFMQDVAFTKAFDIYAFECFIDILDRVKLDELNIGDILSERLVECSCYAYSVKYYAVDEENVLCQIRDDISSSTLSVFIDKDRKIFHTSLDSILLF